MTSVITGMVNVEDLKVTFWTGFNQIISDGSSDLTIVFPLILIEFSPAHDNDMPWMS